MKRLAKIEVCRQCEGKKVISCYTTDSGCHERTCDCRIPKLCPFCGGHARFNHQRSESLWDKSLADWYTIGCVECDYSINTCGSEDEALAKWNRRTEAKE